LVEVYKKLLKLPKISSVGSTLRRVLA